MSSVLSWQKLSEHAGLSEYEAKVYVSLIEKGSSRARKVSMICGVPRTKVYGTLKKLIERGLVVEVPGEPRKFAPTSPANAFSAYLQSYQEKAKNLNKIVSSLETNYKKINIETEPRKEDMWIIKGRHGILRRVREMLSGAEESVDVITTGNGLILFYKAVNKLLDKLEEKGIKIRIGAPIGFHNGSLAQELKYVCEIKNVNVDLPVLFLRVDNRECLFIKLTPDDFNTDSGEDVGVFSENAVLGKLISLLLPKPTKEVHHSHMTTQASPILSP